MGTRSGLEPPMLFPPDQVPFLGFMYFGTHALFSTLDSASVLKVLSGLSSANTPPPEHALCSFPKNYFNITDDGIFVGKAKL